MLSCSARNIPGAPRRYRQGPIIEGLKALLIAESPIAFRRHLIFTEAEPLRRARMPAGK
jgi:hypothetical protein